MICSTFYGYFLKYWTSWLIHFGKLNKTQKDKDFNNNWSQAFDAIRLHRLQGKMELCQNHGVLYYRPLHRDNWGLILTLRLTKHISIQCPPDIIFHKMPSIYSKMA